MPPVASPMPAHAPGGVMMPPPAPNAQADFGAAVGANASKSAIGPVMNEINSGLDKLSSLVAHSPKHSQEIDLARRVLNAVAADFAAAPSPGQQASGAGAASPSAASPAGPARPPAMVPSAGPAPRTT